MLQNFYLNNKMRSKGVVADKSTTNRMRRTRTPFAISYSQIEANIYLGNLEAATSEQVLRTINAKRVLTLREFGLEDDQKFSGIEYLHISVNDILCADLLTHFERCHRFIEEADNRNQVVYVHCKQGISRSSTVVISYLMAKYSISYEKALALVRKQRPIVHPNSNFKYQLKLFEEMDFSLNPMNPRFRLFLLKRYILVQKKKLISKDSNIDDSILGKYFSLLYLSPEAEGKPFRCKKCQNVLFREIHVIKDLTQERPRFRCSNIFTEPQQWMEIYDSNCGQIVCPKCKSIVGEYNWLSMNCKCINHIKCEPYLVVKFCSFEFI